MRMNSARQPENFVTLFDSNFLPAGLCLYDSLKRHAAPFRLWVLCMDELVADRLEKLALPEVSLIRLADAENAALKKVKPDRTISEYCWTLTPFTPQFVLDRDPSVNRVTYIDADLCFFADPAVLLNEFEASGADVFITEHAYAPEYDRSKLAGIYCVQFMTFKNSPAGREVLSWWQERCLEWCYARAEDGKFGDQKYLDDWPQRFGRRIHVLEAREKALGPWNARMFCKQGENRPVFFHFHGTRLVSPTRLLLTKGYRIEGAPFEHYRAYGAIMEKSLGILARHGWDTPFFPETTTSVDRIKDFLRNNRSYYLDLIVSG